jgi:hypothetical protein
MAALRCTPAARSNRVNARDRATSGHPLTGLCQVAIAFRRNPSIVAFTFQAQLAATRLPADSNRTRFLAPLAANRIAPVTHQVQAMSRCAATALAAWAAPEKRWCQAVSKGLVTFVWLSRRRRQSVTGSRLGRFSHLLLHPSGGTKAASNHSGGCAPDRSLAHRLWPNHYTKQRCTSKGFCSRSMW